MEKRIQENDAEVKRNIYLTALELFKQNGYASTSVQEIVDQVGVTKGAFYYYFKSKEEILFLIHDEFIEYELSKSKEIMQMNISASQKLHKIIDMTMNSLLLFQHHFSVFFQDRRYLTEKHLAIVIEKRDQYENDIYQLLKEGIQAGEFHPDLNPRIVSKGIIGMVGWSYQWFRSNGELSPSDIAMIFKDMVLSGITKDSLNR